MRNLRILIAVVTREYFLLKDFMLIIIKYYSGSFIFPKIGGNSAVYFCLYPFSIAPTQHGNH